MIKWFHNFPLESYNDLLTILADEGVHEAADYAITETVVPPEVVVRSDHPAVIKSTSEYKAMCIESMVGRPVSICHQLMLSGYNVI